METRQSTSGLMVYLSVYWRGRTKRLILQTTAAGEYVALNRANTAAKQLLWFTQMKNNSMTQMPKTMRMTTKMQPQDPLINPTRKYSNDNTRNTQHIITYEFLGTFARSPKNDHVPTQSSQSKFCPDERNNNASHPTSIYPNLQVTAPALCSTLTGQS